MLDGPDISAARLPFGVKLRLKIGIERARVSVNRVSEGKGGLWMSQLGLFKDRPHLEQPRATQTLPSRNSLS